MVVVGVWLGESGKVVRFLVGGGPITLLDGPPPYDIVAAWLRSN